MADFSNIPLKTHNIHSAEAILSIFKQIYQLCKSVESILDKYQTDMYFKAEADHLFTNPQLSELNQMITQVSNLRSNWDANHSSVLEVSAFQGAPTP